MDLNTTTALVTGANRGIGKCLVDALAAQGVKKIYATARDPGAIGDVGGGAEIVKIALDIADPASVAAAAQQAGDVTLLINNAGINLGTPLIAVDSTDNARSEIEVNYFGTLDMCRAFAPVLASNGGGKIVNMISMLARVSVPAIGSLCASKAALLIATNGIRAELGDQGTSVLAVMPGSVDTDMSPGGESKPEDIAAAVVQAITDDEEEIWPGPMATGTRQGLMTEPDAVAREFAAYRPG